MYQGKGGDDFKLFSDGIAEQSEPSQSAVTEQPDASQVSNATEPIDIPDYTLMEQECIKDISQFALSQKDNDWIFNVEGKTNLEERNRSQGISFKNSDPHWEYQSFFVRSPDMRTRYVLRW